MLRSITSGYVVLRTIMYDS